MDASSCGRDDAAERGPAPGCQPVPDTARLPRVESESRQSEDLIRLLVEGVGDYAIYMLDAEGRVASWNTGAQRIKGYRADEILGRNFSCFYPPEDIASGRPAEQLRCAVAAGRFEEEGWRVRKDGSRLWANVVITPVYDASGTLRGFAKVTRDVTGRRRAEELLRLNEARLEALVRLNQMTGAALREITDFALESAVALTGSKIGYLAFLNDDESVLTMHSWSKAAMAQCAIIDKPIVYPVVGTGLWGEAVRQRKPVFTNDYQADNPLKKGHPEGHVKMLRHMNAPIFDGERIVIVAGVGNKDAPYDDSDVRQLTLLMQGTWQLIQRKRAAEAISRYNEQLEEANRELEAFSYSVSHDLRTPLRCLDGFSLALIEDCGDTLDERAKDYLHRIRAASQRMGVLIDDLLELSRITRQDLNRRSVDLSRMARLVEQELRGLEPGRDVEFVIEDGVIARGDEVLLRTVLQQLLENAWKFTSRQPRARIGFGRTSSEGQAVYFVRDNGVGFEMEYADQLFGAFHRLHTAAEFPGSGIGLATVQRVIQRHGGRIWADAAPNRGATFYFTLEKGEAVHDCRQEHPPGGR
jgi:PAS domain S-box-containing protein